MYIRDDIERIIKEHNIDRLRCFECSKLRYKAIIKKIEKTFVLHGKNLHWSNITNSFNPKYPLITKNISDDYMWFTKLPSLLPAPEHAVYVLFEDSKDFKEKYWLYEMCISELIFILSNVNGLSDYYIVSKKFDFLISECHEDVVYFVGHNLNLSSF